MVAQGLGSPQKFHTNTSMSPDKTIKIELDLREYGMRPPEEATMAERKVIQ